VVVDGSGRIVTIQTGLLTAIWGILDLITYLAMDNSMRVLSLRFTDDEYLIRLGTAT
jgi:hypothetical protein